MKVTERYHGIVRYSASCGTVYGAVQRVQPFESVDEILKCTH